MCYICLVRGIGFGLGKSRRTLCTDIVRCVCV
jgi:hypothetical protein